MSNLKLNPVTVQINAKLELPGSKSIANRVLLLAALSNGTSIIHNVPEISEDVMLMCNALKKLGVTFNKVSSKHGIASYQIIGCNGEFSVKSAEIFCGNSGTTIRFLCAVLATQNGNYSLTGIQRMKDRPIGDLVNALRQIGADIEYVENDGYPPLIIKPFKYNKCSAVAISGNVSSQYITALLMALPILKQNLDIVIEDELISKPYVEITVRLLAISGCKINSLSDKQYSISNNLTLKALDYIIEPDASSASYFLAIGALNGKVSIKHLSENSLQGDRLFAKVLAQMGAKVEYLSNQITVTHGTLNGITVNMEDMPDVAMTIAVLAIFASGTTVINGIQSWKVKETDRLQAMYIELTKLGASVSITGCSISITPPSKINSGVEIDTYNDHRMAMCFSLIAAGGYEVIINDYECVGKTFANYFDIFQYIQKV